MNEKEALELALDLLNGAIGLCYTFFFIDFIDFIWRAIVRHQHPLAPIKVGLAAVALCFAIGRLSRLVDGYPDGTVFERVAVYSIGHVCLLGVMCLMRSKRSEAA
jgi:hypothetical protein